MARSVPKCKRAAYVYDRDFIVVDDISGVLKMRSECAIDGYGFLSSQGDIRNPQETPPIIREQMAAWPDPRPIGQPVFTPEPDYQYFIFNYTIFDVVNDSSSFDATTSISFDAPISSIVWSVDGVYSATGLVVALLMDDGLHDIQAVLTDTNGNTSTFSFEYTQPSVPIGVLVVDYEFIGVDGATTTTDSTGNTTASGLGIVSGSEFAYIQSNNLFARNNYTTIDDSGALSPYLIFAGDFEIEVALRFSGNWNFYTDVILWQLEDALGVVMELFVATVEGRIGLVGNPLSLVGGSALISGSGAVPDLSTQQVFKVTRVGSTISIYVDNVFKASATSTGTVNAGRFKFFTDDFERYVDYLRISQ